MIRIVAAVVLVASAALAVAYGPFAGMLEHLVGTLQNALAANVAGSDLGGIKLYAVAFAGGLVASISPCILGMLPVNLAYIGASRVDSKRKALVIASAFVAGVVVVNAIFGLFASLLFAVVVEYRAYVDIAVGVISVVMALWLAGILKLSVPSAVTTIPRGAGSFVVGIVFALVASPCASPILVAILGYAAASGSPLVAATAMGVYALGYTAVLFAASVFTAVSVASRKLLAHGELIARLAAAGLFILGLVTLGSGLKQMFS